MPCVLFTLSNENLIDKPFLNSPVYLEKQVHKNAGSVTTLALLRSLSSVAVLMLNDRFLPLAL